MFTVLFRSQSLYTKGMWLEPLSRTRSTTPSLLSGLARCASILIPSRLMCYNSYQFRWRMPSLTMGLSIWVCRRSWYRPLSPTGVTSPWLRLWRLVWEDLPLVSQTDKALFYFHCINEVEYYNFIVQMQLNAAVFLMKWCVCWKFGIDSIIFGHCSWHFLYCPPGPAGTGKTESVKALGHQLGRFVLVFNCDETFDFQVCTFDSWYVLLILPKMARTKKNQNIYSSLIIVCSDTQCSQLTILSHHKVVLNLCHYRIYVR